MFLYLFKNVKNLKHKKARVIENFPQKNPKLKNGKCIEQIGQLSCKFQKNFLQDY